MSIVLNILLTAAVIGYSIYLLIRLIRRPANGCGCCSSCEGCAMAGKCHAGRCDQEKETLSLE